MALIIFDFDGVIADSLHYVHSVYNRIAKERGFKLIDSDEKFSDLVSGNVLDFVDKMGVPKLELPLIFVEYKKLIKGAERKVHIFRGMKTVIRELAKHHELAIISNNTSDLISYVLSHNGLEKYFSHIRGLEFSFHKTKKFEHLLEQTRSRRAYFITDTVEDVRDAKAFRLEVRQDKPLSEFLEDFEIIGVTWGYHSWSKKGIRPDHLVEKPKDLLRIIREL